jgi:hypothetical protein
MPDNNNVQLQPAKAIRLIFEYEGEVVRLISQQPVEMTIADSDISGIEPSAHYVDIRDAAGKTLARVKARGAFGTSAEVFPERAGEPITRVDIPTPKGAFTVVLPIADNADHFTLVKVAPSVQAPGAGDLRVLQPVATDMACFPLAARIQPRNDGGVR